MAMFSRYVKLPEGNISCAVQASPWGGQRVPDDPPGIDTVWKVAAPSPGHAAPSASRARAASGVGHGSRASGAASLPWAPCPPFSMHGNLGNFAGKSTESRSMARQNEMGQTAKIFLKPQNHAN